MKERTSQNYYQRLQRVLEYIVSNIDGDLSVDTLARIANFSPFHFHRLFKAIAGETVGDLIQRIKLEFAAKNLRTDGLSLAIVSQQSGYDSTESFNRVFRKRFGVPPGVYRKTIPYPEYIRKTSNIAFDLNHMRIELHQSKEDIKMQVNIVTKPELKYAYVPHSGDYNGLKDCFEELIEWSLKQGIDLETAEIFSHSYDNPKKITSEELRSEACISISTDIKQTGNIKSATRKPQRYAVHTHKGSYDGIADTYQKLLANWIPKSNEEIDNKPFIEIYQNDCNELPESEWITDLCIPLKG